MENQNPNNFSQNNPNQNFGNPYNQQQGNFGNPQQPFDNQNLPDVPNSTAVLVLGIVSLVFCGLIGLVCSIIALSMARKGMDTYNANPHMYKQGSYNNLKAGRICAIIGLCMSIVAFLFVIVAVIVNLAAVSRY